MGPAFKLGRAGEMQGLAARRADEEGGDFGGKDEGGSGVHRDNRDAGYQ